MPPYSFPLTEFCFTAVERKLGQPIGIKHAREINQRRSNDKLVATHLLVGSDKRRER